MILEFKAKLNLKFYIAFAILFVMVLVGCYFVYYFNTHEILTEDNIPMDIKEKSLFTILLTIAVLSWTLSFFTLVRQVLSGHAFTMDMNGIHTTASAINIMIFIFIVPIRTIPFRAIEKISNDDGVLTLHIDKSQLDINPIVRIFARKKYHLFVGFTVEKADVVKAELKSFLKKTCTHINSF